MEDTELEILRPVEFAAVLWRWLWLIILGTAIAALVALAYSRRSIPIYSASCSLLVDEGQTGVADPYDAMLVSQQLAQSYAQLLDTTPLLREVGRRLGRPVDEADIDAEARRESPFIVLQVRHADPRLAATIANTLPLVLNQKIMQERSSQLASSRESKQREIAALEAEIEKTVRALSQERAKLVVDEARASHLEAMLDQYRDLHSDLLRSLEEIRAAEAKGATATIIVDPAEVPSEPVAPRLLRNATLAGTVAAVLMVALAYVLDQANDVVRGPEDIRLVAPLPLLGTIPSFRLPRHEPAPVVTTQPNSKAAEGYRLLRTSLAALEAPDSQQATTLLIASARPGEGRTTTLVNLGISLAQASRRVLLIDADLRSPVLHETFGLHNEIGLTSLLVGEQGEARRALRQTGIPGLRVLTAGPDSSSPAELLASPQARSLLAQLRSQADYVLIDAPPLLSVADAGILAQLVDGVLLIVQLAATRRNDLQDAIAYLDRIKAPLRGVILNKAGRRPARHGFSYEVKGRAVSGEVQRKRLLAPLRLTSLLGLVGRRPPRSPEEKAKPAGAAETNASALRSHHTVRQR